MDFLTIIWRECLFFKHRFFKISTSQMISPVLYLITFGLGLSDVRVEGQKYLYFLIPGLLAMTSMRQGYSSVSMRISIARLHEKSFEAYYYAPMPPAQMAIGYVLSGAFRGFYAGVFVLIIGFVAKSQIHLSWILFIVVFLNAFIFSALGYIAAMVIDTHYDLNRFSSLVITPMSFLCGTFYSVSGLPKIMKYFVELLPLTHTTRLIRRLSFGYGNDAFSLMIVIFFVVFLMGICIKLSYEVVE